jgi:hypothetical protein
VAVGST